jgi:endonuclease/exonuclease/phosphatase family metal-dependent hydrolase
MTSSWSLFVCYDGYMMELKIVCLNLWQGGILMPGIVTFLKNQNADILLLQEVYAATDPELPEQYRSLQVLGQELHYPHSDFAPAMMDIVPEGKVESGNAILSKFPIIESSSTFFDEQYRERNAHDPNEFSTTPRNLQHVIINANGTDLNVFNFQGVWDMDGDNFSTQRRNMSEVIIEQVSNKSHVILAGDTNAKPTNKAIIAIEEYLTNIFGHELVTSFNMRRKDNPGYATACVDMIFVSSDMSVTDHSCPDIDISDHLPLIATIKI